MNYDVEIRDLSKRRFACTCLDFRANNLGFCKHIEGVLLHLRKQFPKLFRTAEKQGSDRTEIELNRSSGVLCLRTNGNRVPAGVRKLFDADGVLIGSEPEEAVASLNKSIRRGAKLRLSQEITGWLESRSRLKESRNLRHRYELKVQSGEWPAHETKVPLFPYQREGMLHLAFTERALLADEMGLGKTIQAIAACALLHRLGKVSRVLVVTPASLKSEWEEQIERFTELSLQVVYGPKRSRLACYAQPEFFNIVNYEQMRPDALDVNDRLAMDVVILDEAQRIKNWNTKTAQAIKRLRSRYAFVLTGTPIENRIDELHSLVDFLNPEILGPLFRFNREFYQLDERGRPAGFKNLELLHERVAPVMIRRRKADVETELPDRTDHTRLVPMTDAQQANYDDHKQTADKLLRMAKQRPLRKEELEILQIKLGMMRMTCDTNYILDRSDTDCPKLTEIATILEEVRENGTKVIIFSEWERMLRLVRDLCRRLNMGHAWHTGKVPQKKRRTEINAFKNDPDCLVFLSTDSGGTGLNLQNASIVINCDLPWNPAKLEQRIARAWRKHQPNAVTVYNLVSAKTIEEAMIGTLANKKALADGVLDRLGDLSKITMVSGRQAFLDKLEQVMSATRTPSDHSPVKATVPADRPLAFGDRLSNLLGTDLLHCEERFPLQGDHTLLLVVAKESVRHEKQIRKAYTDTFETGGAEGPDQTILQVIDPTTAEALRQLEAAGVIAPTVRSFRSLLPDSADNAPTPLSKEEQSRLEDARSTAKRKLRTAEVLIQSELAEEARQPLLDAILQIGTAWTILHRLPTPDSNSAALHPAMAACWDGKIQSLTEFESQPDSPPHPIVKLLGSLIQD